MDEFEGHMPLVNALRAAGMRERHYKDLEKVLGYKFVPDEESTLSDILRLHNLMPHLEALQRIAALAGEEYHVERKLDQMQSEWNTVCFELLPLRYAIELVLVCCDVDRRVV